MMGRTRVPMKPIDCKKARLKAFEKKRKNLEKKAQELAMLCDVTMCMVLFGPDHDGPVTWPLRNRDEASVLIESLKSKSSYDSRPYDLASFFRDRTKKTKQDQVKKLMNQKTRSQLKLDDRMSVAETNEFVGLLEKKIEDVKLRIDSMKGKHSRNLSTEEIGSSGGFEQGDYSIIYQGMQSVDHHTDMQAIIMENEVERINNYGNLDRENNVDFGAAYGFQENPVQDFGFYDNPIQDFGLNSINGGLWLPQIQVPDSARSYGPISWKGQELFLLGGFPEIEAPLLEDYQDGMMFG